MQTLVHKMGAKTGVKSRVISAETCVRSVSFGYVKPETAARTKSDPVKLKATARPAAKSKKAARPGAAKPKKTRK